MLSPLRFHAALSALLIAFLLAPALPVAAQSRAPQRAPSAESRRLLHALEDAFAAVADQAMPSVVNVSVKSRRQGSTEGAEPPGGEERFREFFGDEFYERFFRRRPPREDSRAAGSGVIVDARGYILTNNHVVEEASEVEVRLSDDRKFKATIVGRDPKTDLAVLKIDTPPGSLPVAQLGDSDRIRVGQWAIAIGNPFGLDRTVTVGIISATGRTRVGVATYEAFIQTDASINPGNSGGPLLSLEGRVIGINTAILSSGQGIGFSIPINMARDIMSQLISKGRVVRGWLGIVIQELTPELAAGFGVAPNSGVLVSDVMKDTPAEAAGLRAGDIIVQFDGASMKDVSSLQRRVAGAPPGRPAAMTVVRDGKQLPLTVRIGEQPGEEASVRPRPKEQTLGLTVEPLTPEAAERFRLSARAGVVVAEVAPGSAGEQAGIRPGDAILELARQPVKDVETFRRIVSGLKPGEAVPVYVQRGGGRNEYVVLTIPESQR
ncbi:MAG TPA: DegQ family serine endoprotease [Methylomirabilota bacterium]|nr:DegQ family serine endoprotease [Methylomirabilota bacterium]